MLSPVRDWGGANPIRYPDADVRSLDPRFDRLRLGHTPIQRLATGMLWAEGPCWFGDGRYLLWSDIPNDRLMRWTEETGQVSVFRQPSQHANGHTRDFQGRLVSCEHGTRRVTRTEHDGRVTVLADRYDGQPLNAPNDVVVHPDGGVWFTDPGYGSLMNYEGTRSPLSLPTRVYRIDPVTGALAAMTDELARPNGLCFSPDYRLLYVVDSGASDNPLHPRHIHVFDVLEGARLASNRFFADMSPANGDGVRADADGNIWASAGWAGEGHDGVYVFASDGARIGQILLPEVCANVTFGGAKRNRLFMAASQSIYTLYVETRAAHIA